MKQVHCFLLHSELENIMISVNDLMFEGPKHQKSNNEPENKTTVKGLMHNNCTNPFCLVTWFVVYGTEIGTTRTNNKTYIVNPLPKNIKGRIQLIRCRSETVQKYNILEKIRQNLWFSRNDTQKKHVGLHKPIKRAACTETLFCKAGQIKLSLWKCPSQ